MRIARFESDSGVLWGELLAEDRARPLPRGPFAPCELANESVAVKRLLPPADPPNIFAIGLNYRRHAEETGAKIPDHPLVFLKATTSLAGPDTPIVLPASAAGEVDYEAELAIVIGREARRVPEARAFEHMLGFTCANDVSARDCQKQRDKQWARGKSFDTFCPLGPWLVTPDEIDPDACRIESRINGRTMQRSSTSDMIFHCRRLIAWLSHQFTLRPGTVILTGTPEGVGFVRTPPVYLRPGDRVEIEIEGIGTLANPVVAAEPFAPGSNLETL
jgi:2-keto-4-pentenoate hydratase/2-oxohepta-3-ene-1,7-dioic acid hydratase in catechol pathway